MAASLLPDSVSRWDTKAARGLSGRDEVVYRSHLVGADTALTREGGGNFSAKGTAVDHLGRTTEVLWMSAWGCDGATTTDDDFPALSLEGLRLLRHCGPLGQSEMIERVLACGLRGEQRRPGIETLTHAFIAARHVDHSHPDAVIALTALPDGRARAEAEFGAEAIWFDYRQFDIDVARELADRIEAEPRSRFVLLANHGIFTWADSSEECYRNSLEAVARATRALDGALTRPADLGGAAVPELTEETATAVLADVLPVIRGALSDGRPGTLLHVDRSPEAVAFSSSVRGPRLSQAGPACPDSLVTVGYRPLVADAISAPGDGARKILLDGIAAHRAWYDAYYERYITEEGRALGRRTDTPRTLVLPGIGVVSSGTDAQKARLTADHFAQTMSVIRVADAAGGYVSLTEEQGVADEYWPLMRLKPQLRSAAGRFSGRVFLVAGADDERAAVLAELLAAEEAHVSLAGGEPARVAEAAARITAAHGERRAVAVTAADAPPAGAVREAVLAHGGFDVLIDLTPTGDTARDALEVLERQGSGGTVLLAGAGRSAADLRAQVDALEAEGTPPSVTVHAVTDAGADALLAAALFFTGPPAGTWRSTVVETHAAPAPGRRPVAVEAAV